MPRNKTYIPNTLLDTDLCALHRIRIIHSEKDKPIPDARSSGSKLEGGEVGFSFILVISDELTICGASGDTLVLEEDYRYCKFTVGT